MALAKDDVAIGVVAQLGSLEDLVRPLGTAELATPTRCDGWSVGDVVAHVAGTHTDIAAGKLEGLGTPDVTERQVVERRGRTGAELADELATARATAEGLLAAFDDAAWAGPAPGPRGGTLGDAIETLWFDAYVHDEDIRAALDLPPTRGDGLRASLSHVAASLTENGYAPTTLAFDGMPEFAVSGGGRRLDGDALAFVLVATGRADPATLGLDESVNLYA